MNLLHRGVCLERLLTRSYACPRGFFCSARLLLLLCFGFHFCNASAAKTIQLRNELIDPNTSSNAVKTAAGAPVSDLYLVQMKGAVGPAERAELRAAGVELLKYVPHDTFIAKFNNVSLGTIAAKNFIAWVGPYRPSTRFIRVWRRPSAGPTPLKHLVSASSFPHRPTLRKSGGRVPCSPRSTLKVICAKARFCAVSCQRNKSMRLRNPRAYSGLKKLRSGNWSMKPPQKLLGATTGESRRQR